MEKYFEINDNGNNIKCKLYCNDPKSIGTVILSCHGFGGSKENNASKKIAETFIKKDNNVAVISFDWPCHGKDVKKTLSLDDCNDYMNSVVNFIRTSLGVEEIYLQATSFGGYLSLKYISENSNPFKMIGLRCPAVNMYDVMTQRILTDSDNDDLSRGKTVLTGFDRKIKITPEFLKELLDNDITKRDFSDYCGIVRIMQGTKDELVMYDDVRGFCENNILDFDTIEDADHRFTNFAKLRECIDIMEELYAPSETKSIYPELFTKHW